jgi:integrase
MRNKTDFMAVFINIYGHALRSADQAAADKFENLFPLQAKKDEKKTQGHS